MAVRIVTVDAFTAVPFAGNPAAVCILSEARPDDWMRHVAREMNLSETAFLTPEADGYRLRWLTPSVEVYRSSSPPPHVSTVRIYSPSAEQYEASLWTS